MAKVIAIDILLVEPTATRQGQYSQLLVDRSKNIYYSASF